MHPRVLCDLSRQLAERLESQILADPPTPVFLCHPLEALETARDEAGRNEAGRPEDGAESATGVLYLYRLGPDPQRPGGVAPRFESEGGTASGARLGGRSVLRSPPLWLRARYLFLLVGGTLDRELEVLAAVLHGFHQRPWVLWSGGASASPDGVPVLPVELVNDHEAWREIGLDEHRLTVSLEVRVPVLDEGPGERVEPIWERDVDVREGRRSGGAGS